MQIRVGYELIYDCPQPTPMILNLKIHSTRAADIVVSDFMTTDPVVPVTAYQDQFGNMCTESWPRTGAFESPAPALSGTTANPMKSPRRPASI